jgi:hypothetical protein
MSTIRKVADVVTLYPKFVQHMSEKVEPLEQEFSVIREINWQLNKLGEDHEAIMRVVQFIMQHRGYTLGYKEAEE